MKTILKLVFSIFFIISLKSYGQNDNAVTGSPISSLGINDSLLARNDSIMAVWNKVSNELTMYDAEFKKVSKSKWLPGEYLNLIGKSIVILDKMNHTTLFNEDFIECANYEDVQNIKKIIQTKLNYNLAAGAKKDSAAFWSIFTPDFFYKDYTGEVIVRQEAESQFKNTRRGLISVSPESFVIIDSMHVQGDSALVYTNQHYVRIEWGNDGKTHEFISNVTHKETWIKAENEWKCDHLEELTEGPYFVDGKKEDTDIKGDYYLRTYWENGIEAFERKYLQDRINKPTAVFFEESNLNALGYKLLYNKKRTADALRIFKINTLAYPNSYNTYDSYAEALMVNNQKAESIENYLKSLKLFPNSANAINMLAQLGAPVNKDSLAVWLGSLIPSNIEYLPNVVYGKGGGRDLKLNLLKPKQKDASALPVIVFIHGGGWTEGSKERGVVPLIHFVQNGYIGVTVGYRLTGEAIFPSQIQDVKCAIRFLRANAKKYNIDVNKIGVWGQSAGSYLAVLLGTAEHEKSFEGNGGWSNFSSAVNAVCDWNAPTDFLADTAALKLTRPEQSAVNRLLGGPLVDNQDMARKANPINYITSKTPPFLILHGDNDHTVSITQSELLYKKLKENNIPVEFIVLKDDGHFGVDNVQLGKITDGNPSNEEIILNAMDKFFHTYLRKE